jgi:beta-N-acetylhexosaminidase
VPARLDGMSERARAGQLFMVGVPAEGPGSDGAAVIERNAPGGVVLTGRGSAGVAVVAGRTAAMQRSGGAATGGVGLFMATDQEGGQVQVLSGPGFSAMPSAAEQGRWSPQQLRASARGWGDELRRAGVNVNLAPVADVLSAALGNGNAPIGRYHRAFDTQPDPVAAHVTAFAQGMQDAGVATTVKHFPGLGRVRDNPDFTAGVTDRETTPDDPALLPFTAGVRAGATFVMTSSATYTRIDPDHRAVFSRIVLHDLIRPRLASTDLIISDDLGRAQEVAAVPTGQRAVNFLAAGGDVVLTVDPGTIGPMIDAVVEQTHHDTGFADLVAAAEERVLSAKVTRGLLPCPAEPS